MSTPYYKILDLALVFIAAIAAYWLRFESFQLPLAYVLPASVFAFGTLLTLSATGFYDATNSTLSIRKSVSLISGVTLAALLTTSFLYLTKTGESYSRLWFLASGAISCGLIFFVRLALAKFFRVSTGARSVLLIGGNQTAERIKQQLESPLAQNLGVCLVDVILPHAGDRTSAAISSKATEVIDRYRNASNGASPITEIWLTADIFNRYPEGEIELNLSNTAATIVYIPEMPQHDHLDIRKLDYVLGIPALNSSFSKISKVNTLLKYVEDKVGAFLILLLLSPLLLVIAVLIKIDSAGPIFYRQLRHGFGGREFEIFKFRTMYNSSDEVFKQATTDDPRVTRVGKWLRRVSLDELPQVFNVLSGSMSLVGPRPHPVQLNEEFKESIDHFMGRHAIKPGITGLAQINGYRGETKSLESMRGRVRFDLQYVNNWSLLLDLKILSLTILHVITTDQAY